ncbi:hypothetical protein ACROYT_G043483 [Oculina patagonica]
MARTIQGQINCSNHLSNSSWNFNNTISNKSVMHAESSLPQTHISVFICLGLLGAAIVFANSVVIFLYRRKEFLKTKTNLCLACLAVSDMLAGAIAVPMVISCNLAEVDIAITICTAMDLSSRFISISTVLHLLLVTMERYFMIIHAMHYPYIVTRLRLKTVLVFIWCFSLGTSLIQLVWIPVDGPSTADVLEKDTIYSLTVFFGIVVPSLLLMGAALSSIFRVLRRQIQNIKRGNSYKTRAYQSRRIPLEGKAVIVFGSMILTFIACWFSYFLDGLMQDLDLKAPYLPDWARVVLMFFRFGSSVLNPILYTFFKEDFKRAALVSFVGSRRSSRFTTYDVSPV